MAKRLSIFHRFVFLLNSIAAILLLAACAVPHISSEKFSFLSFLSLAVPVLVGINILFFLYWILKVRRQSMLSLFVLVFGYFSLGTFLKFNTTQNEASEADLKVMSYNVRGFNMNEIIDSPTVFEDIKAFVKKENPDIICFQEPDYRKKKEFLKQYPYQYLEYIYMNGKQHLGIFSKYPIIKSDLICFPNSVNNGAYADILYKNDTLRIYNIHMQSLGITPGKGTIRNSEKDKLFKKVSKRFASQNQQAKMVADHMASNTYKQILCGDFNNNQFSNPYETIKGNMQDTFIEKGNGYGRTLYFHGFPLRIDFMFADIEFEVTSHTNYDVALSDHYPIMASFKLRSN